AIGADHPAEILAVFLGVNVYGPDNLDLRLLQHQPHHASTNRTYPVLDDADLVMLQYASSVNLQPNSSHDGPDDFTPGIEHHQVRISSRREHSFIFDL